MIGMRSEGGRELVAALNTLSTRLSKKIVGDALLDAAQPTRAGASRRAPRAPGLPDIADNIGVSRARPKGDTASATAVVAVGPTQGFFYGFYLEFGTVKMSAQSFMRPTFDADTTKGIGIFSSEIWRQLAGRGMTRSATQAGPVIGEGAFQDSGAGLGAGTNQPTPRGRGL